MTPSLRAKGRANARPMTGSAKQSMPRQAGMDCFVASLLAMTGESSRRRMKTHQRAGLVVVQLAGLGPVRRAHRHDEFGRLFRRVQRHRVFAGKYAGAHAGADRAGAESLLHTLIKFIQFRRLSEFNGIFYSNVAKSEYYLFNAKK